MLRLAKSLPFFNAASPEDTLAQSFLAPPNGFTITVPTRHGLDNYHGPGTVFQGQLNLQLAKPIRGNNQLRVVFSCLHTMPPPPPSSSSSSSEQQHQQQHPSSSIPAAACPHQQTEASIAAGNTGHAPPSEIRLSSDSAHGQKTGAGGGQSFSLFEIENVLVQDEPLQVKRHTFMFNIKFPRVNLPASMMLTFQTTPGLASTQTTLSSPTVHLKYLPLVPTSIPHYPVIEMAQATDPYTDKPLFKAALESPQRGVCPGESLPLSLSITNLSDMELHSIHLSLARVISYPTISASSSPSSLPGAGAGAGAAPGTTVNNASVLAAEPVTVHSVTIPVTKIPNRDTNWQEAIQFKIPTTLGLIPTTNRIITPLYKVDYYLSVSLPVASRGSTLASWFTPSVKNPPPVDISLIRNATGNTAIAGTITPGGVSGHGGASTPENDDLLPPPPSRTSGSRKNSVDKLIKVNLHMDRITTLNSTMKWPTLIQLPLIPVIIGTVPHSVTEKQLRWPIPNYLDVMDRPCFVRDRFEEEMMQHLESLETLIAEEDDQQDIENMVQAARKSASSEESDEGEQSARSRIPPRFRDGSTSSRRKDKPSTSLALGLGTPPPSPPSASSAAMMDNTMVGHPGSSGGRAGAGMHPLPRAVPRRSMSPKAGGLSKEVLLDLHHSKIQQSIQAGLQDI
ncbi:hypothetical protein EDD11_001623 [Mortierella claussenii]|nr:hypothetical protein EDD11_001623 [Mortierella claussenii]